MNLNQVYIFEKTNPISKFNIQYEAGVVLSLFNTTKHYKMPRSSFQFVRTCRDNSHDQLLRNTRTSTYLAPVL